MEYIDFLVDEKPFCLWDPNINKRDLDFIENIDANFYLKNAQLLLEKIDNEEENNWIILNIRFIYHLCLETMFSLLFATLQAPNCIIGWINKYRISDLKSLTAKFNKGIKFPNKLNISKPTWKELSNNLLINLQLDDKNFEKTIKDGFGDFWGDMSRVFLKEDRWKEFNSIKHSIKIRQDGFHLAIISNSLNAQNKHLLGKSEFGSTILCVKNIQKSNTNLKIEKVHQGWSLNNTLESINLISMSISNTLGFLKICHGIKAKEIRFTYPDDIHAFSLYKKEKIGVNCFRFSEIGNDAIIKIRPKETIISSYKNNY